MRERKVTDRDVSAGCVVAYGLWAVVLLLLAASWLAGSDGLGRLGLATSAAAATATIRQYFVKQNRIIRTAFERSELRRVR